MKTKQIKGAVDILLVGEAPEGINYLIHNKESTRTALIVYNDVINSYPVVFPENLPLGEDWKFHCRLSEMTEDQAESLANVFNPETTLVFIKQ